MKKIWPLLFFLLLLTSCNPKKVTDVDEILNKNKVGNSGLVSDIALHNEEEEEELAENGDIAISRSESADVSGADLESENTESSLQVAGKNTQPVKRLQARDVLVGKGQVAKAGNKLTVHYRGTLVDGTEFDNSYNRNQPFSFVLGIGQVIKGWDLGLEGMKAGGKRQLAIPANLAYGDKSPSSLIPANSDLIFEIELLFVE